MAQKLPRRPGEPAVSHWHCPSSGFTWPQSGPDYPKLRSVHLHQHRQQWTLCSCGVWWLWWPLRWENVVFSVHLLVNSAVMITSVSWVQVESFLFWKKAKITYKKTNQSLQICSDFRSAQSTDVALKSRCSGKTNTCEWMGNVSGGAMSIDMTWPMTVLLYLIIDRSQFRNSLDSATCGGNLCQKFTFGKHTFERWDYLDF